MCLYPRLINNRKYTENKKNGGVIPAVSDKRVLLVPVGCGNCIECRKQKARNWQVRLLEDVRHEKNGKFVTFTFSNESIKEIAEEIKLKKIGGENKKEGYELDNQIAKRAVRKFLERWRKKYKKSLRHWLVTELGHNGTENLHMHGIVWTDQKLEEVEKHWQYGFVWKGKGEEKENYVNEKTVNYLTKYVSKQDKQHEYYKPIVLTSPGMGAGYIKRTDSVNNGYKGEDTRETYRTRTGHEIAMPVYWRNKIYSEEEREKLWIEKLDKQERWVCGEKIDVSKGEEEYDAIVKYYREKNRRLGYGDDAIDWNKKEYENQRRKLIIEQRIKNEKNASQTLPGESGSGQLESINDLAEGSMKEQKEGSVTIRIQSKEFE